MKRRDLLRHLEKHGCQFVREGGDHSFAFYCIEHAGNKETDLLESINYPKGQQTRICQVLRFIEPSRSPAAELVRVPMARLVSKRPQLRSAHGIKYPIKKEHEDAVGEAARSRASAS